MSFYRKITSHYVASILHLLFPHHVDSAPWGPGSWVGWPCLSMLESPTLFARGCYLATSGWHVQLLLGSSRSLVIYRWGKRVVSHLMLVTSTIKAPLHSAAFMHIVRSFPTSIVDYTRVCTKILLVITARVVGKFFPWPLMRLLKAVTPAIVPTPLYSPLLVVELVLLPGCPFHINHSVVRVFIRDVVSYQHFLLKLGLKPVHSQLLKSYIGSDKMRKFHELRGIL